MSKRTYHPRRGDVIHLNLSPSAGHELTGPHFALVISDSAFAKATGFAIVVPTSTKYHGEQRLEGQQLVVRLPDLPELRKLGFAYPHGVRSIDYRERGVQFVAKLPDDFLVDIMDRVRAFIDPDSPTEDR